MGTELENDSENGFFHDFTKLQPGWYNQKWQITTILIHVQSSGAIPTCASYIVIVIASTTLLMP